MFFCSLLYIDLPWGKSVQNYDGSSIILKPQTNQLTHHKKICPLCQPKSSTPNRHWLLKNKPCITDIIHRDPRPMCIWDSFSQIAHKKHAGASLATSQRRRTGHEREATKRRGGGCKRLPSQRPLCVCECGSLCVWGEVYWASELAWGQDQTRACTWVTPLTPQHETNHTAIKSQLLYKLLFCLWTAATLKGQWELTPQERWPHGLKPTSGEMRENVTHGFQMKPLAVVFGTRRYGLTQARRRCQLLLPVSPLWSKSGEGEGWNKDVN